MTKDEALNLALEALEKQRSYFLGRLDEAPDHVYEAITAIRQAIAAPVQGCDFCNHPLYAGTKCKNCGRETETVQERKPFAYANPDDLCADTAFRWCKIDKFTMPVYTPPAAQPAPVQDTEAHYKGVVEGVQKLFDDKRAQSAPNLQAELEATNRQVEILSDALAESRREVAALKAVQEPLTDSFVQLVPDKCDRIVWRGSDYHLPPAAIKQDLTPEPAAQWQ
jgi:hypothetical protein